MVKKVLLMSCLLCLGIQLASAQNVLKGRVVDHQGNPISGARWRTPRVPSRPLPT